MKWPASWPNPPRRLRRVTGLVLVDKPAGPTSFAVIRRLRPLLGGKVGHAGTLDPFATGLLLVLAGKATRLATYLSGLDKSYRAEVQFGAVSSTLDPEGEIEPTAAVTDLAAVRAAAAGMTGTVMQQVPLASAVRVAGERSYARMRRGETEAPPPRPVTIERLEVEAFDAAAQTAVIEVSCSKGTYVRQIAADLGTATGAGAYCSELRRLSVGPFLVDDAGTPDEIAADPEGRWSRSPREALPHLPERLLTGPERDAVLHGRALETGDATGLVRLVFEGELVAVARPAEQGLQPVAVLGA
ncbi:MAG: tRNA pseudouridine55 synthase [Gaiellales bacterium]|jgi:tRNA pseudouridine55 synthase|nr:tRNA pseudouridine55 synthase [Gaiellales bacterium]